MPLRYFGPKESIRDPLAGDEATYTANPALIADAAAFYEDEQFGVERPAQRAPDGWHIMTESKDRDRTVLLLKWNLSEANVEVSYVMKDGLPTAVKARPIPPEESYAMALDRDDLARAQGYVTYNERHPKP